MQNSVPVAVPEDNGSVFDHTKIYPQKEVVGWAPPPARPLTGQPKVFENGMSWEMDESGNHRIVDADGIGGEWATYESIASSPSGQHIAVSQYFAGGLPAEMILEIGLLACNGSLPHSAALGKIRPDQPTIGMLISAGPGNDPHQIYGDDEGTVVAEAFEAVQRLYRTGAGAGYLVNRCADQAQHDRLMQGVTERFDTWVRDNQAPRRSADPRRNH